MCAVHLLGSSNNPPSCSYNNFELQGIREWFRWYKTPDDKPLNAFGFNEEALPKKKALEVIEETHKYYLDLVAGKADKGKLWLK
jgi:inorganic pyrophosphatase